MVNCRSAIRRQEKFRLILGTNHSAPSSSLVYFCPLLQGIYGAVATSALGSVDKLGQRRSVSADPSGLVQHQPGSALCRQGPDCCELFCGHSLVAHSLGRGLITESASTEHAVLRRSMDRVDALSACRPLLAYRPALLIKGTRHSYEK